MGTTTTTFALNKPTVGGDDSAWGTDLNANADKIDDLLDGTTGVTPNLLTGWKVGGVAVTATAAELNKLDGTPAGLTSTEIGYLDGVTSAIQTQLNAKQATDADLTAIAGLTANGMIARTGAGTAAARTLAGTTNQIAVTNGNGVAGNPTISAVIASQAEAEAGTDNVKLMTALRVTQAMVPKYQSAEQTVALSGTITLTHGLGAMPNNLQAWLVCKVADGGYSVGDWVGPIGSETFADGANNGIVFAMNATQVKIQIGQQAVSMLEWTTGIRFGITPSRWRIVVRAW